jgi:hypothetical protein
VNGRVDTGQTEIVCGCFGSPRPTAAISTKLPSIEGMDLERLQYLFHARSLTSAANDEMAKQDQLGAARSEANAENWY